MYIKKYNFHVVCVSAEGTHLELLMVCCRVAQRTLHLNLLT